eukprot:768488-Hanusia_phi.AAC.2
MPAPMWMRGPSGPQARPAEEAKIEPSSFTRMVWTEKQLGTLDPLRYALISEIPSAAARGSRNTTRKPAMRTSPAL